ncbi:MAG TPA: hypothetical protein VE177_00510, partial [Candidatus Binatus sp.]|nr:hypothetical protein [Candidatus Binatus sp.]
MGSSSRKTKKSLKKGNVKKSSSKNSKPSAKTHAKTTGKKPVNSMTTGKPIMPPASLAIQPSPIKEPRVVSKLAVERIEGETIIGDLIVVFPWTRETLLKHGLKLDVDEASDIYMSLGAFAAIQGLTTDTLIR